MARPKGSVNKKKQVKEEATKKVEKEIKAIEAAEEIKQAFGKLEPIVPRETFQACKECGHSNQMHYGGIKGHCNTPNCPCLEFK